METEGQELLLDLGRKLDKLEIDLGEWTEEQETETVRILKMKHRKLDWKIIKAFMGGEVTQKVDSDSSRNKVIGMLREAEKLEKEMMTIKEEKEKQFWKQQQEEAAGGSGHEMDREGAGEGAGGGYLSMGIVDSGRVTEVDSPDSKKLEKAFMIIKAKKKKKKQSPLMEGQLWKEQERLRELWCQLMKKMMRSKSPSMQRILLNQQQILWTKEQALLTVLRLPRMDRDFDSDSDSDSGHEMDRDSGEHQPLIRMQGALSKSSERDSSKGKEMMGQMANDLVLVLSSHLGMLRREVTFLRTELKSRGLAGKNKARLQEHIMSNLSLDNLSLNDDLLNKVNLPYLGCETEDVMDFLLVETHQLLYRFDSLASILPKFTTPISSDKIKKLRLISDALVGISELIKRHKSAADKQDDEDRLDFAGWQATWGSSSLTHGCFDDITTLSPMQFTASMPRSFPFLSVAHPAYEIYSIKLVDLNPNLSWPIDVYGVVAARDDYDHNRNILFCRSSADCQRINQEDPFLHLIGPSRAIVADEPILFQFELKLKYGAHFEDTALFTAIQGYRSIQRYATTQIERCTCTAEISLGRVARAIQATIVGVRVVEGEWPFKYGCKVSCLFSPTDATEGCAAEVVLLDCHAKRMRAGLDGYLPLSRNVVSVGLQGTLRVVTGAYSKSGVTIAQTYHIEFPIQQCQTDSRRCSTGGSTLEIDVAWSRLVMEKEDHILDGY